ncbi:MAG TPA: hypothetical protein QGF95_23710 [Candidatus Latescibacteria bacterium]|jgi:hypothetical protein|nr:hypothetical protein [Gemmatimonadaceae bacterium]MDP6017091.1 hypothetical protein [Candidatus Latescibacterota bacterium]HJP33569.1 hypothetical protein [Candidatus Latescibacterota bacterium]
MPNPAFQVAYVIDRRNDILWFLALPFAAVLFAVFAQQNLPGGALVGVTLWITVPHFMLTGVRLYGTPEEYSRWRDRLVWSPVLLIGLAFVLIKYAPLTLVLLILLWDHQHSFMQQHGFARIYDRKAGAGSLSTKNFDLAFNWIFFGNMLIVSPLFSTIWVSMLHQWRIPIGAESVEMIQSVSWVITAVYGLVYVAHAVYCVRQGHSLNPLKYLFLLASYFLWYYTSFTSEYLMVYAVAHRIMHGVQYNVMIYYFNKHLSERNPEHPSLLRYLAQPQNIVVGILLCVACTIVWVVLTEGHLRDLGFGFVGFGGNFDLFSFSLISSVAMIHYWFDAFIWKTRQPEIQKGL